MLMPARLLPARSLGPLSWDGGSLSGVLTLGSNGIFSILSGGGNGMKGLVITNNGTINWSNTTIYSYGTNNAQIYNYGLWNEQADDQFEGGFFGGKTFFANFGTFLKSGNLGTTVLDGDVVFNSSAQSRWRAGPWRFKEEDSTAEVS